MRSIRRSLLGYLFLLIMAALGAVGVLVDQFAVGAIRSREQSEAGRIDGAYELRQHEAKIKFDADLLAETKALAKEVQYKMSVILGQNGEPRRAGGGGRASEQQGKGADEDGRTEPRRGPGGQPGGGRSPEPPIKGPEEDNRIYRIRAEFMEMAPVAPPVALAIGAALDGRRSYPVGWLAFDGPRATARIQEALRRAFEDDEHPGLYQFTLVVSYPSISNRITNTVVVHSPRLGEDLNLEPSWLQPGHDVEPKFDDKKVADIGQVRRVVTTASGGRPIQFGIWLAPLVPAALPAAGPAPPGTPGRNNFRPPDLTIRIFIHHLRPHSELESRLAAAREERAQQRLSVQEETHMELAQFRSRLTLIGSVTFAALVLGGWFLVARGLSPLHKLSDAVSQVSEKDFRLPVEAAELGRELAPIHARLTQTLFLLQRAFEREKQAVADISHELRTPIASLLATIDVALRKPRTTDQYKSTLEECRLISKQLGQLVERIMTLASLDAGNDHTHVTRVNVADLVGGCAAVIRPLAAANTVTVSVRADDDLALDTDAGKLREVLMNLLHNAVEYNTPGGSIEVTARADAAAVVFEVRDTGIGIPADIQEKIFERFYRADASRHATGVHAGLGLAIVKEYVTRLNGTIRLESEPGVGTTFRVTLPAANDPPPAPTSAHIRAKSLRDDAVPTGS